MKVAFSLTLPDLARLLADIARQAESAARGQPLRSTVSPAARHALAASTEAGDEQS